MISRMPVLYKEHWEKSMKIVTIFFISLFALTSAYASIDIFDNKGVTIIYKDEPQEEEPDCE